jgi:hypothetical protein
MYITLRRDQTTKSATRYDRPTRMSSPPRKGGGGIGQRRSEVNGATA